MLNTIRAIALGTLAAISIAAPFAQAQTKYDVEIRRTSYGIPHIQAKDYGSVSYGLGYAFAEDNLCTFADEIATVNAQRSLFYGPDNTYVYGYRNLNLDFVMALINGDTAEVQAFFDTMTDASKAAIRGYVAGFNRWLKDNAANVPAPCKGTPLVRPITELDLTKYYRRLLLESSYFPFLDGLVAARPPGAAASATTDWNPQQEGVFNKEDWLRDRDLGSNALAIGSAGVESGKSLLLGTPHFPWFGTLRFYQMHLTVPGEVDVFGGSLSGAPIVNIGFNKDVAWTHTNDKAWHFTMHRLQLVPGKPTSYVVDGQERAMTEKKVTVKSRAADGTISDRTTTFYLTQFGPVLTSSALPIPWTTTSAFTIKDANAKNNRLLDQWLAINRASSVEGIRDALQKIRGIPWVNTTGVDRNGKAFYSDIAAVPNVSREQFLNCLPEGLPGLVYAGGGPPIMRGDTAACDWLRTDDSSSGDLLPGSEMPWIIRDDFAHNANDSAWLGNPREPLVDYKRSPMMGAIEQQNLRTRIGLLQAFGRLGGQDGLPGNKFNMKTLQAIAYSNNSLAASLFLADMLKVCTGATDPDVGRGCAALAQWNGRYELTSKAAHLFYEAFRRISPLDGNYRNPWFVGDPVNTPSGLTTEVAATAALVSKAIGDAVRDLDSVKIPLDAPWGQVNVAVRGTTAIPIHGGPGTPLGVYNAITSSRVTVTGLGTFYTPVTGTSYVQTVQFNDDGPVAQGILTYSLSSNPASAYYGDQTAVWSKKQFIDYPFTDAQIKADPNLKTLRLSE